MAGKVVDTEALRSVRTAVKSYRDAVNVNVKKMKDAVQDCYDNLGGDEYSKRIKEDLTNSLGSILKAIDQAGELEVKLTKRIKELEES